MIAIGVAIVIVIMVMFFGVWKFRTKDLNFIMAYVDSARIGLNLNEWREPVTTFDPTDSDLQNKVTFNIPEDEWRSSCNAIDRVLETILNEFKAVANTKFSGLVIGDEIIRQGSSREGLKVIAADEFDCILPFKIEGMQIESHDVGYHSPGLIKIHASNHGTLKGIYPWLTKYGVINVEGYINTKVLQSKVLASILDKAIYRINSRLQTLSQQHGHPRYRVVTSVQTTSLQLTVEMQDADAQKLSDVFQLQNKSFTIERKINIDFVPGMLIGNDFVPDPYTVKDSEIKLMECPRYAVLKWRNKKNQDQLDRELLWRHSSSGYEKHLLDVSRRNQSQRYILTANRILKARFRSLRTTNQLPALVKSYYLKNISMYCILFLTVPSQKQKLLSVKEALGYIIHFLELCLNREFLPHFFHGNPWLCQMFPSCPFAEDARCNLLQTANRETLVQAKYGLGVLKEDLRGCYREDLNPSVVQRFEDLLPSEY